MKTIYNFPRHDQFQADEVVSSLSLKHDISSYQNDMKQQGKKQGVGFDPLPSVYPEILSGDILWKKYQMAEDKVDYHQSSPQHVRVSLNGLSVLPNQRAFSVPDFITALNANRCEGATRFWRSFRFFGFSRNGHFPQGSGGYTDDPVALTNGAITITHYGREKIKRGQLLLFSLPQPNHIQACSRYKTGFMVTQTPFKMELAPLTQNTRVIKMNHQLTRTLKFFLDQLVAPVHYGFTAAPAKSSGLDVNGMPSFFDTIFTYFDQERQNDKQGPFTPGIRYGVYGRNQIMVEGILNDVDLSPLEDEICDRFDNDLNDLVTVGSKIDAKFQFTKDTMTFFKRSLNRGAIIPTNIRTLALFGKYLQLPDKVGGMKFRYEIQQQLDAWKQTKLKLRGSDDNIIDFIHEFLVDLYVCFVLYFFYSECYNAQADYLTLLRFCDKFTDHCFNIVSGGQDSFYTYLWNMFYYLDLDVRTDTTSNIHSGPNYDIKGAFGRFYQVLNLSPLMKLLGVYDEEINENPAVEDHFTAKLSFEPLVNPFDQSVLRQYIELNNDKPCPFPVREILLTDISKKTGQKPSIIDYEQGEYVSSTDKTDLQIRSSELLELIKKLNFKTTKQSTSTNKINFSVDNVGSVTISGFDGKLNIKTAPFTVYGPENPNLAMAKFIDVELEAKTINWLGLSYHEYNMVWENVYVISKLLPKMNEILSKIDPGMKLPKGKAVEIEMESVKNSEIISADLRPLLSYLRLLFTSSAEPELTDSIKNLFGDIQNGYTIYQNLKYYLRFGLLILTCYVLPTAVFDTNKESDNFVQLVESIALSLNKNPPNEPWADVKLYKNCRASLVNIVYDTNAVSAFKKGFDDFENYYQARDNATMSLVDLENLNKTDAINNMQSQYIPFVKANATGVNFPQSVSAATKGPTVQFNPIATVYPQPQITPAVQQLPQPQITPAVQQLPQTQFAQTVQQFPQTQFAQTVQQFPQTQFAQTVQQFPQTQFAQTVQQFPQLPQTQAGGNIFAPPAGNATHGTSNPIQFSWFDKNSVRDRILSYPNELVVKAVDELVTSFAGVSIDFPHEGRVPLAHITKIAHFLETANS